MTPYHFLTFCLHPKYRGRGLSREQLESTSFHNICSMKISRKSNTMCLVVIHQKTYKDVGPELCDLALRLLRLPASSASIERIFSNFSFVQN